MDYPDEEPTQPCTQPFAAIRQAETDTRGILCILFPTTPAAKTAVVHLRGRSPHCVFCHQSPSSMPVNVSTVTTSDEQIDDPTHPIPQTETLSIALRYDPGPKDIERGYCFGRNPQKCDIVIGDSMPTRRISNAHFRIFVNDQSVLMLEDLSTNGTIVDGVPLGQGQNKYGHRMRQLLPGSEIHILKGPKEEEMKFIVRIPKQDGMGWMDQVEKIADATDATDVNLLGLGCAAGPGAYQAHMEDRIKDPQTYRTPIQAQRHVWAGSEKYELIQPVGRGAFATVQKAVRKDDGSEVAVKIIARKRAAINPERDHAGKQQGVKKEVEILEKLRHPHIVQYHECFEDPSNIYIVMEYIGGGDLNDYVSKHGKMAESLVQEVTRQVLKGIQYVHDLGISHRDLKPDNILMVSESPMVVKLGDFGLAKMVQNGDTFLKTFCGTMLYLAPEVFPGHMVAMQAGSKRKRNVRDGSRERNPHRYSQAVDMWSLGCVVYVLLTGRPPFEGKSEGEIYQKISTGNFDRKVLEEHGITDPSCYDFLEQLIQVNPAERMEEYQALEHRWLSCSGAESSQSKLHFSDNMEMDRSGQGLSIIQEGELDEEHDGESDEDDRQTLQLGREDRVLSDEDSSSSTSLPAGYHLRYIKRQRSEFYDEPADEASFEDLPSQSHTRQSGADANLSVVRAAAANSPPSLLGEDNYEFFEQELERQWPPMAHASSPKLGEGHDEPPLPIHDPSSLGDEVLNSQPKRDDICDEPIDATGKSLNGAVGSLKVSSPQLGNAATPSCETSNSESSDKLEFLKATKILPTSMSTTRQNLMSESQTLIAMPPLTAPAAVIAAFEGSPLAKNDKNESIKAKSKCKNILDYNDHSFDVPPLYWGKLVALPRSLRHPSVLLNDRLVAFGRVRGCQITYIDDRISKKHCCIHQGVDPSPPPDGADVVRESFAWFYHTASNPCLLNGQKMGPEVPKVVHDGDEIILFNDLKRNEFLGFRVCLPGAGHSEQQLITNGREDASMENSQ